MSLADFEVSRLLGKGAFASVYQVRRKKDGNIYAMKKVNFGNMNTKEKDNALNEVRILASVQHSNIIGYKESFYDDQTKTLNIVMDFADEGDLDGKLKKHVQNRTNFPENEIWSYLIQMLQGLRALHNAKIMHRDLKSANVFLKKGIIKLGDLNVSKLIKRTGMDHTQTGTPYYASPEVWSDKPYDYKCDIWSVGCIIYELCALHPPFRAKSLEDLFKAITRGKFDPIPRIYSQDLHMIVGILLQVNPALRPDVHKLLSNPIILKKMDYSKNIDDSDSGDGTNLLKTIKVPRNLKEINNQLPKTKNYDIGEVIIERKNSEENMKPGMMDKQMNKDNPYNRIGENRDPRLNPVVSNINKSNVNNPIRQNSQQEPRHQGISGNKDVKDINKVQDQRAELLKKYNNPYVNNNIGNPYQNRPPQGNNNRPGQDIRIRPRTPDAVPKNNVIMGRQGGAMPRNPVNNIYRDPKSAVPGNHQIINRNPVPMSNPYMVKK